MMNTGNELNQFKTYLVEEEKRKLNKSRNIYVVVEFLLTIIGLAILCYQVNFWFCVGLLLYFSANNLTNIRNSSNKKYENLKKIWN